MKGIIKAFDAVNEMKDNYENRKLGRSNINGLTISTAYTSDCGYETAIIDENGVHPVERYNSKEEAEIGHEKWCKNSETITEVVELGYFDMIDDTIIQLKRQ